jgi:hypothetical protein
VTMAVTMLLRGGQAVDDMTRGGGRMMRGVIVGTEMTTTMGGIFPRPTPLDQRQQTLQCRRPLQPTTKSTTMTRTADDATRGEGRTTTTSSKSDCWTMQGEDDGSNNGSGDVIALAVTRAGRGGQRTR